MTPEAEPTDAALLSAHVAGDPEAFGRLFQRHRDRLWAVALRTTGDTEDAADGLQDGMIAAFRRAETYRGEAAVTTWLHRVVVNACLDRLRAAKVRETQRLPDEPDAVDRSPFNAVGRSHTGPAAASDPAETLLTAEDRARVLGALSTLSPDHRAALVLVDMEGFSVSEAAEMLGCAEGTVKSRCHRARSRIAPVLADLIGGQA